MDRVKLTSAEEKAIAREIRACEAQVVEAIQNIPEVRDILNMEAKPQQRTHAAEVARLQKALAAAKELARHDRALRKKVRVARGAWARAEQLRWRLAMSGLHVVRPIARKISGIHMDEEDLMQEGKIGLLQAATRFDPDRGIRFPTYAKWWARAQMTRAVDAGGRAVKLTGCAVEQLRHIRRVKQQYEAAQISCNIDDLVRDTGLQKSRVKELLRSIQSTTSLDAEDEGRPLADVLHADEAPIDEEVDYKMTLERVRTLIDRLPDPRDRFILVRRYGLEDGEFRKLSEVGAELKLSRERVRQIERRALQRLREQVA